MTADPLHPTSTAVILVDARATPAPPWTAGPHLLLCREDTQGILVAIRELDLVLLQCQVSEALNLEVAGVARASGVPAVLNPASVLPRSLEFLTGVHLLTPNLGEARHSPASTGPRSLPTTTLSTRPPWPPGCFSTPAYSESWSSWPARRSPPPDLLARAGRGGQELAS